MTLRTVRVIASLAVVGAGLFFKSKPAQANNCYLCEDNNYCRPAGLWEKGKTTCMDPNQGWDPCTLGGSTCNPF